MTDGKTNNSAPQDREIAPSLWKGYAIAEIARYENSDPEEISSTFDLPCFIELTQEEEKINHRIYIFLHKGKVSLFDFSYWSGDDRPLFNKEIETTKILPISENDESIEFDIHIFKAEGSQKTVWVQYSKANESLQIIEPPSSDSPHFTITDSENIKLANEEAQNE